MQTLQQRHIDTTMSNRGWATTSTTAPCAFISNFSNGKDLVELNYIYTQTKDCIT